VSEGWVAVIAAAPFLVLLFGVANPGAI
jgi:hypothetical protein